MDTRRSCVVPRSWSSGVRRASNMEPNRIGRSGPRRQRALVAASLRLGLPLVAVLWVGGCDWFGGRPGSGGPVTMDTGVIDFTAPGTTYYVDFDGGSDEDPGTESEPWATPQHAITQISAGDEVVFREGIYYADPEQTLRFGAPEPYGTNWEQEGTLFRAYRNTDGSYEPVLFTATGNRPPSIEVEGDYIRIEGLMFGGPWKTEHGRSEEGNEFHPYGGGRLDSHRHIVNCVFFGFSSIRFGALEHSYFAGNIVVNTGTGYQLGDPPVLFFSSKHGVGEVTHAVVDNNIILDGAGMAIEGWHTWRNFIVTRNIISRTWGGFTTDGIGAEAQSPAGEGRDHVFANNVIWKTTGDTNLNVPRQGAEITSEWTHLIGNLFAGYRSDEGTRTTQLVLDLRESSDAYYEKLQGLQILDNGYFGIGAAWDWPDQGEGNPSRYVIVDDQTEDRYSGPGYYERVGEDYEPELIAGTFAKTEDEIDALIDELVDQFQASPDVIHSRAGEISALAADLRAAFVVPEASELHDAAEAWFDPDTRVDIGWIDSAPNSYESFWNAFSNRGLSQWDKEGRSY